MKPVKRRRRKNNRSPSALARYRKRHTWFLKKKLAGKPDLASPEEDQQDSDNSVCVKEHTSPACGSNRTGGATGSSLTGVTALWSLSKTYLS